MNYSLNYDSVLSRGPIKLDVQDVNKVVGMPKIVKLVENGRLVSQVVFEETPIEKMNEGLSVDDFALEVLIENGYNLHRVDLSDVNFEQIDKVASGAEALAKTNAKIKKIEDQPKN